jgi:putative PEP-CTERM system TPR-repeat lipoprotein
LLKRAVKANPQSIMSRVELVSFYSRKGDGDKALLAAQEANAALPNDPRTLELLGRVQLGAGDATLAVGTFSQMVAAQPGAVEPLMRLAGALVALKEYDKAIEKLREALKLNPDLSEASREIIAIYVMSDRPDQALAEIKAIQKRQPNDVRGYVLEGDFWGQQKKWHEAETAFRSAQKLAPDDATIALRIYAAMANGGKPTAADLAEDKWLQAHPKDVIVPGYLAEQALRKKDYKAAARQYQELVVRQPENVVFLNNLAWVAGELGDPKALSYAEKAATLAPGNPSVLDTLGMLLVKQGKVTQGLEKLQKAVQLAPNQSDLRLHLAEALIKAGDKVGARKELEALAASGQTGAKSTPDEKASRAQKSAPVATAKTAPLTCNPGCAAEVAALLKTL